MLPSRVRLVSLVPVLAVLLPVVSAPADAETAATVSLTAAHLAPAEAAVGAGRPFVLANASGSIARIEFDLERGEGLPCAAPGHAGQRGRRFLVEAGSELVCHAEPGRYDYTVFQSLRTAEGEFVHRREQGRVEVR